MDNVNVVVSDSSNNNDNIVVMPRVLVPLPPPAYYSNHEIDLGGFDLDEALAMVAGEPSPRVLLAASKSFVSKLPAVEAVKEDDVCSVCMEGFHFQPQPQPQPQLQGPQQNSTGADGGGCGGNKRVPCGHVYHSECITLWLSQCNSCPLCRRHISPC